MGGFKGKSSSGTARPGTKSKDNNNKKNSSKKSNPPAPSPPSSNTNNDTNPYEKGLLPKRHQQLTLNIFKDTFDSVLSSETFSTTLQTIKQALFERDFTRAFEDADSLAVYAARWSPTRALCYASIFARIHEQGHLQGLISPPSDTDITDSVGKLSLETTTPPGEHKTNDKHALKLLCIGGGAAEIVAFGSFLGHIHNSSSSSPSSSSSSTNNPQDDESKKQKLPGSITLLDSGPWGSVINQLQKHLTTLPKLSKYASQTLQQSNRPMISPPELLNSHFLQQDVLDLDKSSLLNTINITNNNNNSTTQIQTETPILTTLLFTLNELFTTSGILKTTTFLLNLTSTLPLNSLLLVVDSPGSYSETSVGKPKAPVSQTATASNETTTTTTAKKYPMQWLLDKILLNTTTQEPIKVDGHRRAWTKLESHDSIWFRLPDDGKGLDYPISLENMRYQLHLYRLVDADTLESD